jgi:hypothetical protein
MGRKIWLLLALVSATGSSQTLSQNDDVSYLACEGRYTNLCPNLYSIDRGSCGSNQLLRPQLKIVIPQSGTCPSGAFCHIVVSNADKLSGTYAIRSLDDSQASAQTAAPDAAVALLSRVSGELRLTNSGWLFFNGLCSRASRLF